MTVTSSTDAPLIVVAGATGNQGSSVVRYLLGSEQPYRLRGLTRNASSDKAKALEAKGIEAVEVTLDPAHFADIVNAFKGAAVVFAVTNFWEHTDVQREIAEGKAMVDAAVEAGVGLFIYSALPNAAKLSGGKLPNVHHFNGKAEVEAYALSKASSTFKYKSVQPGFYAQNLVDPALVQNYGAGWSISVNVGQVKVDSQLLPMMDVNEYGLWVKAVIEKPEVRDDSRPVLVSGQDITLREAINELEKKTKVPVAVNSITTEQLSGALTGAGLPPHLVEDLCDNWRYILEVGYFGNQDVHWVDQFLDAKPSTFTLWVAGADTSRYV